MPRRSAVLRRADPYRGPDLVLRPRTGTSRTAKPGPASPCARWLIPDWPSLLLGLSGRPRISSQRLQHPLFLDALQAPLQKIDFQGLLADVGFSFSDCPLRP